MSRQGSSDLYLSPVQQDLLMAALNSNQSSGRRSDSLTYTPMTQTNPGSGQLDYSDESPFLDFDPDGDFDDSYNYDLDGRMIGDIPGDLHEKRKSIDGKDEDDEGGGKRREGEDKTGKKPGRKPLTSEPTSKRKAQNRAAQRAFRERKEKHLKDLETTVDDLKKQSEATTHENGLLRAQVERMQVELKEYRKRLSWMSTNSTGRSSISQGPRNNSVNNHNDFQFEFPKFGDLPPMQATNLFSSPKPTGTSNARASTLPGQTGSPSLQTAMRNSGSRSNSQGQLPQYGSASQSPVTTNLSASPQPQLPQKTQLGSVDSLSGLFSPSILEATRQASYGGYFPQAQNTAAFSARPSVDNGAPASLSGLYSNSSISNSDSPSSSSESHNAISSIGTSPEPSLNSPGNKLNELGLNTINEENQVPTFGFANTPGLDPNSINWMAQQNNNTFDPVLFGGYRETQENVLSQDFGSFFNDAYPLPDLGSPLHNYSDVAPDATLANKTDLLKQVDAAQEGADEVVPNNDKPMTCNKIWDRLQSMEKFRNGEIDIDNLCSELRAKAKCSEGGAVVDKKDVDKILGVAK